MGPMDIFLDIAAALIGAALGVILISSLVSWAIRATWPAVNFATSDLASLLVTVPVATAVYMVNSRGIPLIEPLIVYGVGGIIAYTVTRLRRRRALAKGKIQSIGAVNAGQIMRPLGWILVVVTLAGGLTCIFMAFRSTVDDAAVSFFAGVILLASSYGLWRLTTRPSTARPAESLLDDDFFTDGR